MKRLFYMLQLVMFMSTYSNGQQNKPVENKTMDDFELTPETAHPKAKALLTEEFYWSPIVETAPFGSDAGSDSFSLFRQWRANNPKASPVTFLKELLGEWEYPSFDMNLVEGKQIKELLTQRDPGMIIDGDNAVIGIGFGQFVLEGKIDADIKDLTTKAIKREMTDELLSHFASHHRNTRKEQLNKMLIVVDKMNR